MADYMHDIQESQKGDLENLNPEHLVEQMRGDRETYKVFYERFVRCIVGKKMFDYMIADADDETKEEDVVTTSDEALALVAFENGYENWCDVWERSEGKVKAIRKTEDYPKDWISTVPTKYTTRTDENGKTKEHSDRSWSAEGINRFNMLVKKVHQNRKDNPGFFKFFVGAAQDMIAQKCVRHETPKQSNFPDAINELFYDPESSNPHAFSPEKRGNRPNVGRYVNYGSEDSE